MRKKLRGIKGRRVTGRKLNRKKRLEQKMIMLEEKDKAGELE